MKLTAGGPQHLLDVQALLSSSPPDMDIERLKRSAHSREKTSGCLPAES